MSRSQQTDGSANGGGNSGETQKVSLLQEMAAVTQPTGPWEQRFPVAANTVLCRDGSWASVPRRVPASLSFEERARYARDDAPGLTSDDPDHPSFEAAIAAVNAERGKDSVRIGLIRALEIAAETFLKELASQGKPGTDATPANIQAVIDFFAKQEGEDAVKVNARVSNAILHGLAQDRRSRSTKRGAAAVTGGLELGSNLL